MFHLNNGKHTQFIWNVMSHIKQWMYNSYRVPYQFHRLRIGNNGFHFQIEYSGHGRRVLKEIRYIRNGQLLLVQV
jgi:hypothetical protein